MKALLLTVMLSLTASFVFADAINVSAYQRWPWNGKVDITFTIPEPDTDETRIYAIEYYVSIDGGEPIALNAIEGDGANNEAVITPGLKKAVWDAYQDMPNLSGSKAKIGVIAEDITEESFFMKMDLATGKLVISKTGPSVAPGASSKRTELWFKNVKPGTFTMGSGTGEVGRNANETQHEVTITKPFMIGVFELTQAQCLLLTGENPSYHSGEGYVFVGGDCLPVDSTNYNKLRGTSAGATWPNQTDHRVDDTSLIGKIRAHFDNKYLFDLPTEAQWEYACRAIEKEDGSYDFWGDNVWNNGLPYDPVSPYIDNNLDKVGWNTHNANTNGFMTTREVGLLEPNGLGLYDMHGNVAEMCLDWQAADITSYTTDPVGPTTGSNRIRRGGNVYQNSFATKQYRQAYRSGVSPSLSGYALPYIGCRLVLILP